MIIFSSFASSDYYLNLAENTYREFSKLYPNSRKKIFTLNDIPKEYIDFANQEPRGFGYWWWLGYIYKQLTLDLQENEIVFWSEARSGFKNSFLGKRVRQYRKINWLNEILKNHDIDLCVWQMENHLERDWTTADLLNHFSFNLESKESKSGQFTNHFISFRVNNKTKKFFDEFYNFSIDKKNLWLPNDYLLENYHNFVEPRWLQSLLSLSVKKNEYNLKIKIINNKDIYKRFNLLPQIYKHEKNYHF